MEISDERAEGDSLDGERALTRILDRIAAADDVAAFVEQHKASFSDYAPGEEHQLEWPSLHQHYCSLVEMAIETELERMGCSGDDLAQFAQNSGDDFGADKLLARLLAKSDYGSFCAMMQAESCVRAVVFRSVAVTTMDDDDEDEDN